MKQLSSLPLDCKQEKDRHKEEGIYSIKHPWVKSDYLIADLKLSDVNEIVSVRVVQPITRSKAKGRNRFPTFEELMHVRNMFFEDQEQVWIPIPKERDQYYTELVCARVNKVQQAIAQMNEDGGEAARQGEFIPE